MKVKNLIKELEQANPEAEVLYYSEEEGKITRVEHDAEEYDEVWLSKDGRY